MRRAVLDTNALVSALISSKGSPAIILDMVEEGLLKPVYCNNIMAEYIEVLNRPKFGFPVRLVNGMLDLFDLYGIVAEPKKSAFHMADESDRAFYDTAVAASASLITGNVKHYPAGPPIISPAEFVAGMSGRCPPGGLNQCY